jgi:hypothetical protein
MANWPATLAAVRARGPRCDHCKNWTFRPGYLGQPKSIPRRCPDCLPRGWYSLLTEIIR